LSALPAAGATGLDGTPAVRSLETTLHPRGPFSLADSAGRPDLTRRFAGGVLELALEAAGPARARVWQRWDGSLGIRLEAAAPEAALDALRFVLALDLDHSPFLRMAACDRLLSPLVRHRPGLRPLRLATVEHALLRALAGQLVASSLGAAVERAVIARACERHAGLRLPPTRHRLARLSAARAEACGLSPRRAAALVGIARRGLLERLHGAETRAAVGVLLREPAIGPWSAGLICLYGLGRPEEGLVGDLGLVRLCSALAGGPAGADETAALLSRYEGWAGFASVHLLHHPLAGALGRRRHARGPSARYCSPAPTGR
jgi:AraC family transcriptional regulator of adaptative response / DNA-3-methyladenine glycosylase II